MNLPFFIAKRYLFAKKSHNVINIISLISAVGIAIGTTALVVVLSVYNGFESLVKEVYSTYEADLVIAPSSGKFFSPRSAEFEKVLGDDRIASVSQILQENVFATYASSQGIAVLKGVDSVYVSKPGIRNSVIDGKFELMFGQVPQAVVGRELAREMRISPRFVDPLEIYYPRRGSEVSLLNPMASLSKEVLFPAGIVSANQQVDENHIFVPIGVARRLLGCGEEVSSLELAVRDPQCVDDLQRDIESVLGEAFVVKNRYQQNETIYKMMTYEKGAIYMILLFIIVVVSCNVFGSLSMLIIEKSDDIVTLKSLGATNSLMRKIFALEGWLITFAGMIVGVILGVLLCLVQQHFGLIKMPGNFIIQNYPVEISAVDILIVVAGVSGVGLFLTSLPAFRFFKKN